MAVWTHIRANTWNNARTTVPVPSGSNRMIVFMNMMDDTNPGLMTITLDPDGLAIQFQTVVDRFRVEDSFVTIAYLPEASLPTAGVYEMLTSYPRQTNSQRGAMLILQGVLQQDPVRAVGPTAEVLANSISNTIPTPPANYIAMDIVKSVQSAGWGTPGAGQTQLFTNLQSNNWYYNASAADSVDTFSWTFPFTKELSQVIAYAEYDASVGVSITDIDADPTPVLPDDGAGLVVNGSNFSASGNAARLVFIPTVFGNLPTVLAQTVVAGETTTAVPFDVVHGDLPHTVKADGTTPLTGLVAQPRLEIENVAGDTSSIAVEIAPRAGTEVVVIGDTYDEVADSLLQQPHFIPDGITIAPGDQIQWETTSANGYAVTVDEAGLVTIAGGTGTDTFGFWLWTAVDGRTSRIEVQAQGGSIVALAINGSATPILRDGDTDLQLSGAAFSASGNTITLEYGA